MTSWGQVRSGWVCSLLPALVLCGACAPVTVPSRLNSLGPMPPSTPLPGDQARVGGELCVRLGRAMNNTLDRTRDRYTLPTFVASAAGTPGALWWDWPGDQLGRWYSLLHVAQGCGRSRFNPDRKLIADVILPVQTADGNFGRPGVLESDDARIPSGNAFALRGLMDAYLDTQDPRLLQAAHKLAGYFETLAPKWETRSKGHLHEFYGHCIDGLVALYEQDGDQDALNLAERLAQHAGRTNHTHHALSLCRGLIDLARVTGKVEYLDQVEDYLAWCREHQTVTGGLPESMPVSEQDEGCGLSDWIIVNLMMFAATGEDRYLDDAEHALINHFAMNQFRTGGFGHRSFSQEIVGGKKWQGWDGKYGSENPGCCSVWGAWALGQIDRYAVTTAGGDVLINLYPQSSMTMPDRSMRLEMHSDYPALTRARILVNCPRPETCTLALRVPQWAQAMHVKVDGWLVKSARPGERVLLSRQWGRSTVIDIEFISGLRTVEWPIAKPQGVGIFQGPVCLGLCSTVNDVNLPWAILVNAKGQPLPDADGRPQIVGPDGQRAAPLEPVANSWKRQDVKDPARYRILFQTRKAE